MERKEGGQATDEQTKSPENRETQLRNAVTERGIRLTAGGEFLDTINPQNTQQQTELTQIVSDIVDGKKPVDPRIAQAIGLYSDQDRANHWGSTPFEQAYQQAQDIFTEWAISTKTLENTDERSVYEDTVAVLGQLGVTIENFATLSQGDQDGQFSHLYTEYYAKGTQVEAIGNAFLRTARNTDNTVDVLLLQRRLDSLDVFLNTCGTEAKAVVREYVLKQGFINGDKQAKDIFKQAATTIVHPTQPEKRDPVLKKIYDVYKGISSKTQAEPGTNLSKPAEKPKATAPPSDTNTSQETIVSPLTNEAKQPKPEESGEKPIIISSPTSDEAIIPPVIDEKVEARDEKQKHGALPMPYIRQGKDAEPSKQTGGQEIIKTNKETDISSVVIKAESKGLNDPNEDANFTSKEHKAAGVFDGVGGYAVGEKASNAARKIINENISLILDNMPVEEAKEKMKSLLVAANNAVIKVGEEYNRENQGNIHWISNSEEKPATAAVIVKILDRTAIIGHIGDCRVYLLREGKLHQLTLDDNSIRGEYPDDDILAWKIQAYWANPIHDKDKFSEETKALVEYKDEFGITKMLGRIPLAPTIYTYQVVPGDKLLLTSDGIHDNLSDEQIEQCLVKNPDNKQAAERLIADAEATQRKPDDETAVIIEIQGDIATEPPKFVPLWEQPLAEKEQRLTEDARVFLQQFEQVQQTTDRQFKFVPGEFLPQYINLQRYIIYRELAKEAISPELQNAYTAIKTMLERVYSDALTEVIRIQESQTSSSIPLTRYLQLHPEKPGELSKSYIKFLDDLLLYDIKNRPKLERMSKEQHEENGRLSEQGATIRYMNESPIVQDETRVLLFANYDQTQRFKRTDVEVLPFLDDALEVSEPLKTTQRQVTLPQHGYNVMKL